ncbi:hypothetical protein HZS_3221 [Henneguya salminicola]|nr:hypothetical protein HZS_3221 [Henneguya salminicola]
MNVVILKRANIDKRSINAGMENAARIARLLPRTYAVKVLLNVIRKNFAME